MIISRQLIRHRKISVRRTVAGNEGGILNITDGSLRAPHPCSCLEPTVAHPFLPLYVLSISGKGAPNALERLKLKWQSMHDRGEVGMPASPAPRPSVGCGDHGCLGRLAQLVRASY